MITRRTFLTATAASVGAVGAGLVGSPFASPAAAAPTASPRSGPLTNLAHLRWLLDDVRLADSGTHTTIDIATSPSGTAPWTYANALPGGGWARVGGGNLDPATGYWSQGAYNADDIARARPSSSSGPPSRASGGPPAGAARPPRPGACSAR